MGGKGILLGVDFIYEAFSNYLLWHTNRTITNKELRVLHRIYRDYQNIDIYLKALNLIKVTVVNEKNKFSSQIQKIIEDCHLDNYTKCISLAKILLDQLGSEEEVKEMLNEIS